MTRSLVRGATVQLPSTTVRAVLRWAPGPPSGPVTDIDLSLLLLGSDGKVRSEGDLIFYNQPRHPTGQVRRLPKRRDADGLMDAAEADLPRLGPEVARVILAASTERGFAMSNSQPRLLLMDAGDGSALAEYPLAAESPTQTALVCGELFRAGGGWEFRAGGRGVSTGLAGLAEEFGVPAGETPASAAAPTRPPSLSAPSAVPPPALPLLPPPADPRRRTPYSAPQPDPAFTLPPQGPQFLPQR